ncbi:MAG TPA: elongation factor Ts [Candidatus Paceibacterota bacterium]
MEITTDTIKKLREMTSVSVMQCKKALEEAGGDLAKAEVILKKHSATSALKKADRALKAGVIGSYTHDDAVGAMALLSCESDFVAKNPEFVALARELAMQVAAMDPEDVDSLLEQSYIKDEHKTILNILNEATQKFGERVEMSRFVRISAR